MGGMGEDLTVKVVAVIVVYAFLLLVPLATLLRSLHSGHLLALLKSILEHARHAMRKPNEAEIDEVAVVVRAKTQQMKVEHFRTACGVLSVVTTLWVCAAAYEFMLDSFVLDWDAGVRIECSLSQLFGMVLLHCLLVMVVVFPMLVTWRTIDVFYAVILVLGMVSIASFGHSSESYVLYRLSIMHLPVVFMNIVRRDVRVVGPLNVAFAVVSGYTITVHADRLDIPSWRIIGGQCFFLSAFAGLAQAIDITIETTIRRGLEMESTKELLSAVGALLRSCCDVVVEIDREGLILSPALDLGGFLLRGPDCCLQNVMLSELMCHEEDKKMFLRQLHSEKPSGLGLAEAIHARMRDGNDNLLRVEILFFEFQNMASQPRYMVGLREFSDTPVGGKPRPFGTRSPDASGRSLVIADDEDQREEEAGSFPSLATSAETISDYYDSNCAEAPMAFVDSTDPTLPIRGCSAAFRMFIGRLQPGSCMTKLVKHGDDFARWVQTAAASAMHGEDCPDCRVTLQMRQGQLKATCRVLPQETQEGDGADDSCDFEHTRLLFFNIKRCRGHGSSLGGTVGPLSLNVSRASSLKGTPVVHMSL